LRAIFIQRRHVRVSAGLAADKYRPWMEIAGQPGSTGVIRVIGSSPLST